MECEWSLVSSKDEIAGKIHANARDLEDTRVRVSSARPFNLTPN